MAQDESRKIGFVGLGIMGKPMARNLLKAGYELTVYDTGEQVRCFGHVAEVVDCVMTLMETDAAVGGIFNIGSDRPVSMTELANEVISRVGAS